jgi:hypothetical protein
MLQKLDSEIRECYQHAVDCSRNADESRDSRTKQEFLEMAKRWLSLAHSYELAEQLSMSSPESNNPTALRRT